jgi:hypothetical protein
MLNVLPCSATSKQVRTRSKLLLLRLLAVQHVGYSSRHSGRCIQPRSCSAPHHQTTLPLPPPHCRTNHWRNPSRTSGETETPADELGNSIVAKPWCHLKYCNAHQTHTQFGTQMNVQGARGDTITHAHTHTPYITHLTCYAITHDSCTALRHTPFTRPYRNDIRCS